jgi:hypothetical protein
MMNLEGFSADARKYVEQQAQQQGPHSPGILYRYRNEPGGLDIVSDKISVVVQRIG